MQSRYEIIVSKSGIQKILKKCDTTGLYEDKKRSGRPIKLSERSRRIIRRMSLRNRTVSVRSITSNFNIQRTEHISRDTISKILINTAYEVISRLRSRLSLWSNIEEELSGLVPSGIPMGTSGFQRRVYVSKF